MIPSATRVDIQFGSGMLVGQGENGAHQHGGHEAIIRKAYFITINWHLQYRFAMRSRRSIRRFMVMTSHGDDESGCVFSFLRYARSA